MPQWTEEQIDRLQQGLEECGQELWVDDIAGWEGPAPPCVDSTVAALTDLGIAADSVAAVAEVVFAVAASDPSTAPRPPTAHRDPMSPGSLQTEDYDMVSDPEAQPAAASDEPSSFGDEELVGFLTFDAVVASVQAASTGAGKVRAKKIVAVMGATGAGKSTFTHYLHGDELTIVTEPSGRRCIDVTTGSSRVGHGTSFTKDAEIRSLGDGTTTVDLPGGFDTKGARAQLRNGVLNALVLTGAEEVRLVLVLPLDTIRTDRGGETLMRSLQDIERLFADVPEALKGVRVVISGACRNRNLEQYQTLSQSDLVQEALPEVEQAIKTARNSGVSDGVQLLSHICSGLRRTQTLSQRVSRAFGPCVVFNPLDAASRAAVVEAIVGGAPVRGLPGAPAFRPSLPVGVTADIDAMLRGELQQYTEEVTRRTAPDLHAAAGRLMAVASVVAVMGRVGFLTQHRGLPHSMAEAASQENEKEKVAFLQCVKEGNVTGLLGALERLDLLRTALWAAVEPVSPRIRWTNRVGALAMCASELSSTLGGVNVAITDARLVLREASPCLAVARGIDDVACSAAAEEFVGRLVAALTTNTSALKDVRRPSALAASFQDIVKATEAWAVILPHNQARDVCAAAREIVVDTTKATMDHAQVAAHDTGNLTDGAEEALALLNDFARCTELLSIVGAALDVVSAHRAVIDTLFVSCTLHENATAAEVNDASERAAKLQVRDLPAASDALQQSNPVADLCALIPADGHLGCAIVSQALQECAELIKRAVELTVRAFQAFGIIALQHLLVIIRRFTACVCERPHRSTATDTAMTSIEAALETAQTRGREFVESQLRDLPTPEMVQQITNYRTVAPTIDHVHAVLQLSEDCLPNDAWQRLSAVSEAINIIIIHELRTDPFSLSAVQTFANRFLPMKDSVVVMYDSLKEEVRAWFTRMLGAVRESSFSHQLLGSIDMFLHCDSFRYSPQNNRADEFSRMFAVLLKDVASALRKLTLTPGVPTVVPGRVASPEFCSLVQDPSRVSELSRQLRDEPMLARGCDLNGVSVLAHAINSNNSEAAQLLHEFARQLPQTHNDDKEQLLLAPPDVGETVSLMESTQSEYDARVAQFTSVMETGLPVFIPTTSQT